MNNQVSMSMTDYKQFSNLCADPVVSVKAPGFFSIDHTKQNMN